MKIIEKTAPEINTRARFIQGPAKAVYGKNLTLFVQVGALSASLRFQRPLGGGHKSVLGGRPASRRQKSKLP